MITKHIFSFERSEGFTQFNWATELFCKSGEAMKIENCVQMVALRYCLHHYFCHTEVTSQLPIIITKVSLTREKHIRIHSCFSHFYSASICEERLPRWLNKIGNAPHKIFPEWISCKKQPDFLCFKIKSFLPLEFNSVSQL